MAAAGVAVVGGTLVTVVVATLVAVRVAVFSVSRHVFQTCAALSLRAVKVLSLEASRPGRQAGVFVGTANCKLSGSLSFH